MKNTRPIRNNDKTAEVTAQSWHVYIVENRLGHWYTGITTDVERRIRQHSEGKGARALRGKGPLILKFSECVGDKARAARLEYQIKRWTRKQKAQLVAGQVSLRSCDLSPASLSSF